MPLPLSDRKKKALKVLDFLARWLLGGVFVYASYHKIVDPSQFAHILSGYDLFPLLTIYPIAVFVPFFELLAGAALIMGIFPRGAVVIINGMLVMFIFAISINLVRGHEFDCGCFSFSPHAGASAAQLLIRDIFFLAAGICVLFYRFEQTNE